MKKLILLFAVISVILAGCVSPPPQQRVPVEAHVEILPGDALSLSSARIGPTQAIAGLRGVKIEPKDVVVYFRTEQLAETIKPGTSVDWISNLPRGLRARVREAKKDTNKITILVEGIPLVTLNEEMRFSFPDSVLKRGEAVSFISEEAKFEILQGNLNLTRRPAVQAAVPNYVYINGSLSEAIDPVDLRVNLEQASLAEAIEEETKVDWVENVPEGLTVKVQPAAAGAASLILSVSGTPKEAKNEAVRVLIPDYVIGAVEDFPVPNEIIRWRILGGTVAPILIDGTVNSAIIAKDITITLIGAKFAVDLVPGTPVDWITNMPAGLIARVKRVRAGEDKGIITIAGTPSVVSTDFLDAAVPAEMVDAQALVPILSNADARFDINDNVRQVSVNEVSGGSSNPAWLNYQRGPLNVPVLPMVKDFQGAGIITVRTTAVERLGADNQYHWTGETINYGRLMEEAKLLGAHGIINVVIDYTDSVENREVIRELAAEHVWSEEELDKISRGILKEVEKDGVRYSVETSHVITRTYIGSALAIKYLDGLSFFEAEQIRAEAEAAAARNNAAN